VRGGFFAPGRKFATAAVFTGTGSIRELVAMIVPNSLIASVASVAGELSDAVSDVELISEPSTPLIATSIALFSIL
jgi:hypothetical protein